MELAGIQCLAQGHDSRTDAYRHGGLNSGHLVKGQVLQPPDHPVTTNSIRTTKLPFKTPSSLTGTSVAFVKTFGISICALLSVADHSVGL